MRVMPSHTHSSGVAPPRTMREHPRGVRPHGNLLTTAGAANAWNGARKQGLGALGALSDDLIVRMLGRCGARDLAMFGEASRVAAAFAVDEDLWRAIVLGETAEERLIFEGSWRETFVSARGGTVGAAKCLWRPVYSDVLFHKWRCLTADIEEAWVERDNAPRICVADVSIEEFRERYEVPGVPVVITGAMADWPALKLWSKEALVARFGKIKFHAGGFEFPLESYFKYSDSVEGRDDQPLYIFDKQFAHKAPALGNEYTVPEYFAEDLFHVLGEDNRPDYRWLIAGPARSGSSFHKDPNATSAWNAVVRGRKKWILFPPHCIPPGVHPSRDGSDVTVPVSVTEWFVNFYDRRVLDQVGAVECVVNEGETIFVPLGWWHCVLNLEFSIAITQNYVSATNFSHVASWLLYKPSQISGCRNFEQARFIRHNFATLVAAKRPELRDKVIETHSPSDTHCPLPHKKKPRKGLWKSLQTNANDSQSDPTCEGTTGFSFGF